MRRLHFRSPIALTSGRSGGACGPRTCVRQLILVVIVKLVLHVDLSLLCFGIIDPIIRAMPESSRSSWVVFNFKSVLNSVPAIVALTSR